MIPSPHCKLSVFSILPFLLTNLFLTCFTWLFFWVGYDSRNVYPLYQNLNLGIINSNYIPYENKSSEYFEIQSQSYKTGV